MKDFNGNQYANTYISEIGEWIEPEGTPPGALTMVNIRPFTNHLGQLCEYADLQDAGGNIIGSMVSTNIDTTKEGAD